MAATTTVATTLSTITAGMGEIHLSSKPDAVLSCLGIGSCIALCIYAPAIKTGGIAHIVLPECPKSETPKMPGKFAETAVIELLGQLTKLGANKSGVVVKLIGGAQMIQAEGFGLVMQMGQRNLEMTRKALSQAGVRIAAEDVGGNQGRSVWLHVETGKVITKTAYGTRREL